MGTALPLINTSVSRYVDIDQVMRTSLRGCSARGILWNITGKNYYANMKAMKGWLIGPEGSPTSEPLFEVTVDISCWKVNRMTERDSEWLQRGETQLQRDENDRKETITDDKAGLNDCNGLVLCLFQSKCLAPMLVGGSWGLLQVCGDHCFIIPPW